MTISKDVPTTYHVPNNVYLGLHYEGSCPHYWGQMGICMYIYTLYINAKQDGGRRMADSGRRTADGGRWMVDSGWQTAELQ